MLKLTHGNWQIVTVSVYAPFPFLEFYCFILVSFFLPLVPYLLSLPLLLAPFILNLGSF